ncbi:MAG: DUF1501 domain-containing protein [Pirellulaceae bacterium]|jgi:hypothetical protein|nr:DUF1501 domain-containing protein [Pirellulaceae bacterium]
MLRLYGPAVNRREPFSRREMLRAGALGVTGLGLCNLLDLQSASAAPSSSFGKAKNCIVLFLSGGASHIDMYDPKPNAPEDVRGEFSLIQSKIPSVPVSEHLPLSSKLLDRGALIRSMTHTSSGHAGGGYIMFTGYKYEGNEGQANFMSREDHPHMGAALAKISPGPGPMVPFSLVPRRLDAGSGRRAGQWGGRLGGKYDPLQTNGNPNDDDFRLDHLPLVANRPPELLIRRKRLLDQVNAQVKYLEDNGLARALSTNQEKALEVMASAAVRRAVNLADEDPDVRSAYGRNLFGQSVLLGRRMLDAGARLVQATWLRKQGQKGYAWDSHWQNFESLREDLIPPFDLALHALITDLEEKGQLDETLVVVAGEFGRTPRVTLKTAGREHWPGCFSVLLFGGGIRGGQVYGESDKIGAYPASDPVSPADLTATIYHCMGVDPRTEIRDQTGRPMRLSEGAPLDAVLT